MEHEYLPVCTRMGLQFGSKKPKNQIFTMLDQDENIYAN